MIYFDMESSLMRASWRNAGEQYRRVVARRPNLIAGRAAHFA